MSKPVVAFVGDDAPLVSVTLPDDSVLVGYTGQPMQRKPEWFLGPNGDRVYYVSGEGVANNLPCLVCKSKGPKHGYLFHQGGEVNEDPPMVGIFQCLSCGTIDFLRKVVIERG